MISAPGDWNIDREVGKRLGVCCVYYPKGTTWDTAETVMYPNLATKTRQTTLKEFMEQDLRSFREHDPEMTYEDVEDVPLQGKRVAKVRLYHNVNRASSEGVAYVDEEKFIALVVVSSKTKKGLNDSIPLFRSVLRSYTYMDVRATDSAK